MTWTGRVTPEGRIIWRYPTAVRAFIQRFAGQEIDVEIRRKGTKRSLEQNRFFHALILPWAHHGGHGVEDLKRDLLREVFGVRERTNPITGEVVEALNEPHTSTLSVEAFSTLVERTFEIAARCGIVLLDASEYRLQQEKKARSA